MSLKLFFFWFPCCADLLDDGDGTTSSFKVPFAAPLLPACSLIRNNLLDLIISMNKYLVIIFVDCQPAISGAQRLYLIGKPETNAPAL